MGVSASFLVYLLSKSGW